MEVLSFWMPQTCSASVDLLPKEKVYPRILSIELGGRDHPSALEVIEAFLRRSAHTAPGLSARAGELCCASTRSSYRTPEGWLCGRSDQFGDKHDWLHQCLSFVNVHRSDAQMIKPRAFASLYAWGIRDRGKIFHQIHFL